MKHAFIKNCFTLALAFTLTSISSFDVHACSCPTGSSGVIPSILKLNVMSNSYQLQPVVLVGVSTALIGANPKSDDYGIEFKIQKVIYGNLPQPLAGSVKIWGDPGWLCRKRIDHVPGVSQLLVIRPISKAMTSAEALGDFETIGCAVTALSIRKDIDEHTWVSGDLFQNGKHEEMLLDRFVAIMNDPLHNYRPVMQCEYKTDYTNYITNTSKHEVLDRFDLFLDQYQNSYHSKFNWKGYGTWVDTPAALHSSFSNPTPLTLSRDIQYQFEFTTQTGQNVKFSENGLRVLSRHMDRMDPSQRIFQNNWLSCDFMLR